MVHLIVAEGDLIGSIRGLTGPNGNRIEPIVEVVGRIGYLRESIVERIG